MTKEQTEVVTELNAYILQAWGEDKSEGKSIMMDPALARSLEWIRDSFIELAEKVEKLKIGA